MFNRRVIGYLADWKNKGTRKPLILRGARQVGKTSAVLIFGKKHFRNVIHVNLEKAEHARLFRKEISLQDFEKIIQVKFHQKITPGDTLVFIDEIQNSPALIKLIRFFREDRPEIHVIGAGSLLEAKIEKNGLEMPVGRVEYASLYPLDFFEYLEAKGEDELLGFLRNFSPKDSIPDAIHTLALEAFHEYAMIGGMPEAVKVFLENRDMEKLKTVYSSIFTGYCEDIHKYSTLADSKYLTHAIETSPLFAGTAVTYEKFGGSAFRSREMGKSFEILEKVMLLYQVRATKSTELPLVAQTKRPKKLLFLDVGLVNYQMNILESYLDIKDLNEFYRGRIAEQTVGQNILARFMVSPPRIFYWAREKPAGSAEVDFCLNRKGTILGLEVKSGKSNRLRSLLSLGCAAKESRLIRIYGGQFRKEKIEIENRKLLLISLPFYLVPRILDQEMIDAAAKS